MKLYVVVLVAFLVALIGHCNGHHGHPLLHQFGDIKQFPRKEWDSRIRAILESRQEAKKVKNAIDDAIIAALEQLRELMSTGYPELGIPPLDPLYIEHGEFGLQIELLDLQLTIDKTTVTKLSGFVIDKIGNDLEHLKADFGITLPEIDFEGMYDVLGDISGIEVFGNGSYTLSLTGLSTWGTVTIGSEGNSEDGAVFVKSLDLDFSLQALKTGFENLMGGGEMGDLMNELISEEGPAMLEQMKPDINQYIATLAIDLANPILSHYTLKEILDLLGVTPN